MLPPPLGSGTWQYWTYSGPWQRSWCHSLTNLLERIDVQAHARHKSRSGFLRELAERELAAEASRKRSGIQALLGDPVRLGGDATTLIRRDRRSH